MSDTTFEQLLEENFRTIHAGEVVEGKVFDVKEDVIYLDIKSKSDGILPKSEYTSDASVNLLDAVHVGDVLTVKILRTNDGEGHVPLTYKRIVADKGSKVLEDAFNNGDILTAKVTQVVKGGLSVVVDEIRVFIPAGLLNDTYESDLDKYIDQEIQFKVIEYNPKKRRYIGDRKCVVVEQKQKAMAEVLENVKVGDIIEGTVKNVTDFGAFVDIGGIDGLLHISEMSWGRVENPKKVFKSGDKVKVQVKDIQGSKISLTAKFADENPWKDAEEKYAIGNVVTGKVARMTDFGAFIQLDDGVDGLLHVSQISKNHVSKPSDVLNIGDEVTAKVVDFKLDAQKISLSVKELLKDNGEDVDADEASEEAPAEDQE